MAGLLAWAADVVGGNANANGNGVQYIVLPKFSGEEEEYLKELDQKATSLQRTLQLLRQRIPQSLPHLHTHASASNSALTLELHAHSATRLQAQQREASLQEENAAYGKAIAATQQQIIEKSKEVHELDAKLKDLDESGRNQTNGIEELQALLQERENNGPGDESKKDSEQDSHSLSSLASVKEDDLENKRNELKLWEDKLMKLEETWTILQHNLAQQPSPAQREKELERRLRSLTEQLVTKQAQAEAFANERNALEFQLEEANETRRQLHLGNVETNFKRNKVGRSGIISTLTAASGTYDISESKVHSEISKTAICPRVVKAFLESGSKLTQAADVFCIKIGHRRLMLFRSLIAGYILALHIVVFIIISFAKLGR